MTTVNMRPGKAQTFGIVEGTPVFGLPGNPAAAYVGFQMLIRPALRTMQGYRFMDHPVVKARLTADEKNRDPRRIYLRANLTRTAEGYEVTPAKNQSSGLFGPIQKTNCLAVMPRAPSLNLWAPSSIACCSIFRKKSFSRRSHDHQIRHHHVLRYPHFGN